MQTVFVYIIIALSVAYAAWRIYALLQAKHTPCDGCQGCVLRDTECKNGENRHCTAKKQQKNLAN